MEREKNMFFLLLLLFFFFFGKKNVEKILKEIGKKGKKKTQAKSFI
jgi:hypothetical protein